MNRRDILKYTALMTGAAISAPILVSLSSCNPNSIKTGKDYELSFFYEEEFIFLSKIVDIILPETDSPSATQVGVHQMIDHMIGKVYTDQSQSDFKTNFSPFRKNLSGKDESEWPDVLKTMEASTNRRKDNAFEAYQSIKQQTIAYYLSSEEIGTKYLNYLPVPGKYMPCISLEEAGGKAWTL